MALEHRTFFSRCLQKLRMAPKSMPDLEKSRWDAKTWRQRLEKSGRDSDIKTQKRSTKNRVEHRKLALGPRNHAPGRDKSRWDPEKSHRSPKIVLGPHKCASEAPNIHSRTLRVQRCPKIQLTFQSAPSLPKSDRALKHALQP